MQIASILDAIQRKIQDDSYSRQDDLLPLVNEGLGVIATEAPLPGLFTIKDDFSCPSGTHAVALPDDYGNWLKHAYNLTRKTRVRLYGSVTELMEHYPALDASAPVCAAAVYGNVLYVQGVPTSAETLQIAYYAKPTMFSESVSDVSYLPEHLQQPLLVNYVCKEVYNEIEDGVEGLKVNWNTYQKRFEAAMGKLYAHIGQTPQVPEIVQRTPEEITTDAWLIDEVP